MKRTFTLIVLLASASVIFAQNSIEVTMGASYVNEVFYSFEDGTLKSSARTNWDIAFSSDQMSVSVLANTGTGLMLYTYPNGDTASWATADTTGITWNPLYNSIVTWETGAFNTNTNLDYTTSTYDYGWGNYNTTNHYIVGDSIYILALADGSYKKLVIEEKNASDNQWTFKYADLDGSNEVTKTFDADDYSTTFVYYSLANNDFVDQEPGSRWQLLFTKYFDYTYMDGYGYNVTGVLMNSDVYAQEVAEVDTLSDSYELTLFNDTISQIGYDWKSFDHTNYSYSVTDSLVFFVQDSLDSDNGYPVYKIIFTGFSGSSDGTITFSQEKVYSSVTTISEVKQSGISVYPNPADSYINILHDLNSSAGLSVYNINGTKVLSSSTIENELNISALTPGIYSLIINTEGTMHTAKFIKK